MMDRRKQGSQWSVFFCSNHRQCNNGEYWFYHTLGVLIYNPYALKTNFRPGLQNLSFVPPSPHRATYVTFLHTHSYCTSQLWYNKSSRIFASGHFAWLPCRSSCAGRGTTKYVVLCTEASGTLKIPCQHAKTKLTRKSPNMKILEQCIVCNKQHTIPIISGLVTDKVTKLKTLTVIQFVTVNSS